VSGGSRSAWVGTARRSIGRYGAIGTETSRRRRSAAIFRPWQEAATTPDELTALARRMNATPRKCLQFKTPAEVLQAFVTAPAVEGTVSRFGSNPQ
jgi:hypothetical protein